MQEVAKWKKYYVLHKSKPYKIITYFIAIVWLANGLLAKVMNLSPRHQEIVGRILGDEYSRELTLLIGLAEIIMAIWIVSRFKAKLNAIAQISIITLMNILEFILVPELLMWGKLNIVFAMLFVGLIWWNELD